jgi:hypothetical protein
MGAPAWEGLGSGQWVAVGCLFAHRHAVVPQGPTSRWNRDAANLAVHAHRGRFAWILCWTSDVYHHRKPFGS